MNWFGQVGHVAVKDIKQTRWFLLVYVAVVAVATRDASRLLGTRSGSPEGFVLFVVACGMFVAAALVQADSPTRSDAFWASRPFSASAVFAAKLLVITAMVIGVPLAGQFTALLTIGAQVERIPLLLLAAAWSYALWLLAGMVVAALTKDLRTFAAVFIGVCVVLVFATSELTPSRHVSLGHGTEALLTYGGAVTAVALLFTLYRTRDTRPRTWVAGIIATVVVLVGSTISASPGLVVSTARAEPAAPRRIATLIAEFVDVPGPAAPAQLRLHVRTGGVTASATESFSLTVATADVYLRNGLVLHLPTEYARPFPVALGGSAPWSRAPGASARGYDVTASLNDAERAAVSAGFDSVTVEGHVTVSERRALGTMPLAENATVQLGGARLDLTDVARSEGFVSVSTKIFSVDRSDGPSLAIASNVPDLILANDTRGQEVAFHAINAGSRGGVLVLPGNEAYVSTTAYTTAPRSPEAQAFVTDDAWMSGAHVVVATWVQVDSYAVRARVTGAP